MRTFQLIDANGDVMDLTLAGSHFLYNIDGLGFSDEYEFQRIGERFGIIRDEIAQGEIEGYVKFWQPGAEKQYFDFVQFCQNKPHKLVYNPGIGAFYRDGIVTSIGKSDSADGALKCSIRFSCTTPFYRLIDRNSDGGTTEGKVYNYKYNYRYSNSYAQSVVIDSDSYQDSPVKLRIYGYALNPSWRWYLNNQLQGQGRINATIEEGRFVEINTTTIPYEIKQYDAATRALISDLYQQADFSTQRFVRLGHGRNVISVAQEGTAGIRMSVEAHIEYASV